MSDILKGLASSFRTFLFAWVFPSAIAVAIFALWIFPRIEHLPLARDIASLTSTEKTIILGFAAFALGVILNAADTRLYHLLEGYTWPTWAQAWGVSRQRSRKEKLQQDFDAAQEGWRKAMIYEQLRRFPADDAQITPTALGNALRAYETYGANRFRLDSQFFWGELYALAPERLQNEYDDSRATSDLFVAVAYLSGMLGLIGLLLGFLLPAFPLLWLTAAALFVVPLSYRYAMDGITYWGATTQAIVNLGREQLAAKLSLAIPASVLEEREMWGRIHAFLYYPYEEDLATKVDRYRWPRSAKD